MQGRGLTILFALAIISSTLIFYSATVIAEGDDCPDIDGTSTEDRVGCPDSDGDGWSDPDENWAVRDGADALPNERTQHADRDGDGWGDSSSFDAMKIDHFPDDKDLHRAVLSVGCNPPDHTLSVGKSSHFECTVKNEGMVPIRLYPNWDSKAGIEIAKLPERIDLKPHGTSGDQSNLRLDFTAKQPGVTGGNLFFNKSDDPNSIYSLPLGVLVDSNTPQTSSSNPSPSLDPIMEKANSFASWMSETTNVNFTAQSVLALFIVGPLVVFVIARRTQTSVRQRREARAEVEEEPSNEDEREEEVVPESLSLEDMAADPNEAIKKPKRGVKGAEGMVLASGMVEVMVGDIDMPSTPNDAFNVLADSLDDSEIEGENWSSDLDDMDDDEERKVSSKHRIDKIENEDFQNENIVDQPTSRKKKTIDKGEKKARTSSKKKEKSKTKTKKKPKGKVGHTRGPGIDLK